VTKLEQLIENLDVFKEDVARAEKVVDGQCLAISKEKFGVFVGVDVVSRSGERGRVVEILPNIHTCLPQVKVKKYQKTGGLRKVGTWFFNYSVCKDEVSE